jgi:REP element-mobilizing transposase RayT
VPFSHARKFIKLSHHPFILDLALTFWQALSKKFGVAVHAYCMMRNHIHFLATPDTEDGISLVMKQVGSRYAQWGT